MRAGYGVVLALALVGGATGDEKKDEKIDAKLLVGKWKQTEPKDGPQFVLEFTADGKVFVTATVDKLTIKGSGTYELKGNKLTMKTRPDGADDDTEGGGTITKLTKDVLEATDLFDINVKAKRVP